MPTTDDLFTFETLVELETYVLRLGAAMLLGGLIGLDRELKEHAMGVRTTMLVSLGAALFGLMGTELGKGLATQPGYADIQLARIIEGVVTGIGFLGAGAIIKGELKVRGATTAAMIWTVAGVGLACGFGLFKIAFTAGIMVIVIMTVLGFIKHRLGGKPDPDEAVD
jgi:putative Mg2+ transporter-C (MgtC) family protein